MFKNQISDVIFNLIDEIIENIVIDKKIYRNSENLYKLRDWIHKEQLDIEGLCVNECDGARKVLDEICKNKKIDGQILKKFKHYPKSIYKLTEKNYEWVKKLLIKQPSRISWVWLSSVPCDWAGKLFENNLDKIDWKYLSGNQGKWAYKLLLENPDQIHCGILCSENNAEWVPKLLEIYPKKLIWYYLCENQSMWAMKMLEKNPQNINWSQLSSNPSIFELDYQFLNERIQYTFGAEFIAERFHPRNIPKFLDWGFDEEIY